VGGLRRLHGQLGRSVAREPAGLPRLRRLRGEHLTTPPLSLCRGASAPSDFDSQGRKTWCFGVRQASAPAAVAAFDFGAVEAPEDAGMEARRDFMATTVNFDHIRQNPENFQQYFRPPASSEAAPAPAPAPAPTPSATDAAAESEAPPPEPALPTPPEPPLPGAQGSAVEAAAAEGEGAEPEGEAPAQSSAEASPELEGKEATGEGEEEEQATG
jgi:hypothetical protein